MTRSEIIAFLETASLGRWTFIRVSVWPKCLCECSCGTKREVHFSSLTRGVSKSCGCLSAERASTLNRTHGQSSSSEYNVWQLMVQRCTNPHSSAYAEYGGKGITVCDRWLRFENFFADVGRRPTPKHQLDRYPDNNGDYEPGNVRWATKIEQMANRSNSVFLIWKNERMTIAEAARRLGVPYHNMHARFRSGTLRHLGIEVERDVIARAVVDGGLHV